MAAVSIPPSPQVPHIMASRRVPLANVPNATNSPLRTAPAPGGKRSRSYASDQRELPYGQAPPAKKLIVEVDDAESRRHGLLRRSNAPPTAFQKKLEAVREAKAVPRAVERSQKPQTDNLENIRQWQRHYKKMFPTFVFYFDAVSDESRSRFLRQVRTLGAQDEKFFSKAVTHVITTRPVPAELETASSTNTQPSSSLQIGHGQPRTINPADLGTQSRPKVNTTDILFKAKEMSMKIWSAEKLSRMLNTMFNTDTGEQPVDYTNTHRGSVATQTRAKGVDLQKLLQNEKLNGPADRDYTVATQEMVQLRGHFIYIHDMDELTRPVMVREYTKVANKEDGKWPQFRLTGPGKCPFIEDKASYRHGQQEGQKAKNERQAAGAARTRAAAALEAAGERQVLEENNNLAKRVTGAVAQDKASKPLEPPKIIPAKRANPDRDDTPPMFGSAQASIRAMPRFAGGQPIASGIQPSNITSAIRSQMISSTAAAPGARVGNTKEMNQLKRKVLEKNSAPSANSIPSSYMNDVRAAINNDGPPPRAAKRKAQETLGHIHEDMTPSEEERHVRKIAAIRRKRAPEKELKPGYCENCREKFNDFDEHIVSRKHRKFATDAVNWRDLDELLAQLERR